MGTNYFLHFSRNDVERGIEGVHIGKQSCGWVFHFQAHNNPKIRSVQNMKAFTKLGFIYDEYEKEYTYEEFWKMVEHSKDLYIDGSSPYILCDPEYPEEVIPNSWEDEGLAFSEGDFC